MAYVPGWERLSAATERVMEAAQVSKDQAQADICQAIADKNVKIRGKLSRHSIRPMRSSAVLEGTAFEIPTDIKSADLDWERSRPVLPWMVRREAYSLPGHWDLEWIELFATDVTNALCTPVKPGKTASGAVSTKKSQPAFERARRTIEELYPQGVPGQAVEPNVNLCRRVGEKLRTAGLPGVSDDTILRAAGRRK